MYSENNPTTNFSAVPTYLFTYLLLCLFTSNFQSIILIVLVKSRNFPRIRRLYIFLLLYTVPIYRSSNLSLNGCKPHFPSFHRSNKPPCGYMYSQKILYCRPSFPCVTTIVPGGYISLSAPICRHSITNFVTREHEYNTMTVYTSVIMLIRFSSMLVFRRNHNSASSHPATLVSSSAQFLDCIGLSPLKHVN